MLVLSYAVLCCASPCCALLWAVLCNFELRCMLMASNNETHELRCMLMACNVTYRNQHGESVHKFQTGRLAEWSPFLSVTESFACEVICIIHDMELPAVDCDNSTNVQHVRLNGVVATSLEEGLPILDVILQVSQASQLY